MKRILTLIWLLLGFIVQGQNFPQKEKKLVYDVAGVLSSAEAAELETKLRYYNDSTSTQISIVTIPSLDGYEVADYANRLAREWGIGQQGQNNGLLLLAAIKEHKIRIEVGYGLEGTITDAISKRIIEEALKPNFKSGNYYQGFDQAIDKVVLALRGEFKAKKHKKGGDFPIGAAIVIILFIVLFVFFTIGKQANSLSKKNNIPFWLAWTLLNSMTNNHGRWKDFSGGGGSFGGGGSGPDFGGFGGGDFGGGGASGDW
jgi:uncharacterized protein